MITAERVREVLIYDRATGLFKWRTTRSSKAIKGRVAGNKRPDGYVTIIIDRERNYAHRLAWLYVHGEWPAHEIDHIDLNPSNNSWNNLRHAMPWQNQANQARTRKNTSGFKGVRRANSRQNAWQSGIMKQGRYYHLGVFPSPELAHAAYARAARELNGSFARIN